MCESAACTHQDVVRLDVSVKDAAPLHQLEGQQQLLRVGAHRLDVQADVLAVLLQHLSQVHAATQKHHRIHLQPCLNCCIFMLLKKKEKNEVQTLMCILKPPKYNFINSTQRNLPSG